MNCNMYQGTRILRNSFLARDLNLSRTTCLMDYSWLQYFEFTTCSVTFHFSDLQAVGVIPVGQLGRINNRSVRWAGHAFYVFITGYARKVFIRKSVKGGTIWESYACMGG
jgi:hypothetical protein